MVTTESAAQDLLRESAKLKEESGKRATELARSLIEEGRRALDPLLEQVKDEKRDNPPKNAFQLPVDAFEMALDLDESECGDDARDALNEIMECFEEEEEERPPPNHDHTYDVVVVGAGASGVGMGLMLTRIFNLDPDRVLLVERSDKVGESFRRWPKEMRFISPSFNSQGWTASFDQNSVAFGTSPAYTLQTEHPTGEQYANYLHLLAEQAELKIRFKTEVTAISPIRKGGFKVDVAPSSHANGANGTEAETLRSRYVVWAAGEFQYPLGESETFPGSALCRHNSTIRSWSDLPGDDFVVIGGYESGMDALYNLSMCGKRCTVVSSTAFWHVATDDPSTELAPYTMERVRQAFKIAKPKPKLLAPLRIESVEKVSSGKGFALKGKWAAPVEYEGGENRVPIDGDESIEETGEEGAEIELRTPQAPLLCTGFAGSVKMGVAKDLFAWGGKSSGCMAGAPLLTDEDESTKTPGLFLVGPQVRHEDHVLCFVYKYRQRFGVVADVIARGLDFETEQHIEQLRELDMFLDDFSCCKGACGETC